MYKLAYRRSLVLYVSCIHSCPTTVIHRYNSFPETCIEITYGYILTCRFPPDFNLRLPMYISPVWAISPTLPMLLDVIKGVAIWLSYIFYLATFGRMIQVSTTFVGIRAILKGGKYEPTILKKLYITPILSTIGKFLVCY